MKNLTFQSKSMLIGKHMLHLLPDLEFCTGNEHYC
jgi:hypothetical protein